MFLLTCSRKDAFHGAGFEDFVSAATVADIALVMWLSRVMNREAMMAGQEGVAVMYEDAAVCNCVIWDITRGRSALSMTSFIRSRKCGDLIGCPP